MRPLKILAITVFLIFLPLAAFSQTILSVGKASSAQLEVTLSNDEPVAAIQFTLNSDGPVLLKVEEGSRLEGTGWLLSSNKISESVFNVVLIRSGSDLPEGTGVITSVAVSGSGAGTVSLSRVVVASPDARKIPALVENLEWSELPVALGQNFPNPFNPVTTVPYTVEEPSTITLAVYDVSGREIKRMVHEERGPGSYLAVWNGTDESGYQAPSGVYFVRLQAGTTILAKKMILTK